MPNYVLDTSAILTVLNAEDGTEIVLRILEEAKKKPSQAIVYLPFMALMELEYLLLRSLSQGEVERILTMIEGWKVFIEESSPEWRREAARIKATQRLSVADSWIAALAILRTAKLIHKDPEYESIPQLEGLKL
jgi:predicted nucleic acid-binding protein